MQLSKYDVLLEQDLEIAKSIRGSDDVLFVVYGGEF